MKPKTTATSAAELAGWPIEIETYRLGDVYHCTITNVDPGARFARADGSTREDAEAKAIEKAERYLDADAPVHGELSLRSHRGSETTRRLIHVSESRRTPARSTRSVEIDDQANS